MTFCTLFNVNYLDKGLALFESLEKNTKGFKLYVLTMDDKCYEILRDIKNTSLIPIRLEEFESEELLSVKQSRKLGEYYWTCSSWLISYVLDTYKEKYCTYIDADLYIFSEPSVIIEEMERRGASVQIVSHRFMGIIDKHACKGVGKYCVEFNTFKNDENGRKLLNIWKHQVIDDCSVNYEKGVYGDQKYLDNWVNDYSFVIDTEDVGAGVGPWNLSLYKWKSKPSNKEIIVSRWGKKAPLLFVHFENITYLDESTANASLVSSWRISRPFINYLYVPYLQSLREIRKTIKDRYNVEIPLIKSHPGFNKNCETERDNIVVRLYRLIFVEKRLLRSLLTNIFINTPNRFYHNYSIIKF